MEKKKRRNQKAIVIAIIIFLAFHASAFGNKKYNLGPYVGFYSQTMGEKTNFGFRSGLELKVKGHYLLIPKIKLNFPNESEKIFDEEIVKLKIDYSPVIVPRFEFGLDLGYTYKIAKLLSPYLTAGLTYGKYQTPHSIIYDQFGIPRGEIWAESRLWGIPVSIGNYFEITKCLKIKANMHSAHIVNTAITGSSMDDNRNENQEIHKGNLFGGGVDVVYFLINQ